jgi:urease accessory protein
MKRFLPALMLLASSATALHAHHLPPGYEGVDEFEHSRAMLAGLHHPLSGWDHCLALAAIGCVAALGFRRRLLLPALFFTGLLGGGFLGMQGVAFPQVPFVAAAVLLAAGAALMWRKDAVSWLMALVTGVFGVCQGVSHVVIVAAHETMGAYASGFVMASAVLMFAGALVATLGQRLPVPVAQRTGASLLMASVASILFQS